MFSTDRFQPFHGSSDGRCDTIRFESDSVNSFDGVVSIGEFFADLGQVAQGILRFRWSQGFEKGKQEFTDRVLEAASAQ